MKKSTLLTYKFIIFAQVLVLDGAAESPELSKTSNSNPYWHQMLLDPGEKYLLEWLVDWPQERIVFNVTMTTKGYVVFGLSQNGEFENADIVIGGIAQNGSQYFGDYHTTGDQNFKQDQSQDWKLHSGWENDTHTFLQFSRQFETCDDTNDIPITDDTLYLVWAHSDKDVVTEQLTFQNSGSRWAYLRDPDMAPRSLRKFDPNSSDLNKNDNVTTGNPINRLAVADISDARVWTIHETFQIPAKRTTYWCNIKKFTRPAPGKHHTIGYNVRISPEPNMHHMILYRCMAPPGIDLAPILEPFAGKPGHECYEPYQPLGPIPTQYCLEMMMGHGIGGISSFLPTNAGIPIGEKETDEYFLLQVHYDNPEKRSDITSDIQLDIYYTSKLRENDAAVLTVGHQIPGAPSILIPPGERNHMIYGHCSSSCTRKMLPVSGIKVVSAMLHAHDAARGIKVQHFRNGKELPWILSDTNYQFRFQPHRFLKNEVTILPGDQVTVECSYDTILRNTTLVGAYGSDQEMCQASLIYYSRLEDYPACRSEIDSRMYMRRYLAGVGNTTWNQKRLEFMATFPPHLAGMTLSDISDSEYVSWDNKTRDQLRKDHTFHRQKTFCPSLKDSVKETVMETDERIEYVSYPAEAPEYAPASRCDINSVGVMREYAEDTFSKIRNYLKKLFYWPNVLKYIKGTLF